MSYEFTAFENEVVLAQSLSVSLEGRTIVLHCGNVKVFLQGKD
jgi:hypothetical protein